MKCFQLVLVLVVFDVTVCQDFEESEDSLEETAREVREYSPEAWRPAEFLHQGNLDWIPRDDLQDSETKLKRRRLRKRKRKPAVFEETEDFEPYPERPIRRRVRPQRLDTIREPWQEMEEDAIRKPNVRRRVTPAYQSSEENKEDFLKKSEQTHFQSKKLENEPTSIKASILVEDSGIQAKPKPQISSISDLKTLLKKSGGSLSLSELLQQKNLSLSELLSGDEKAISVLTEKPQVDHSTEISTVAVPSTKYQRLPPSVGLKKFIDRNFEQDGESVESLSAKETLQAQRKRLALLGAKESKLDTTVSKFDVATEPTTERRIFVPAHPKYYTSLNFKPDFASEDHHDESLVKVAPTEKAEVVTITSTSPSTKTTTESPKAVTPSPKLRAKLPTTNAKLKVTTKTTKEIENIFPFAFEFTKPVKLSLNEIMGFKEADGNIDEPLRMPIDIETIINNEKPVSTTTDIPGDNVTLVTAREEIMEIIRDPSARDKLSEILERRNMTLQELVEQRERGSSQLHLADIFHNKTREPEPKEEPFIGRISPEYFNGLKAFDRKQKSLKLDNEAVKTNRISTIVVEPSEPVTPKIEKETTTGKMEIVTEKHTELPSTTAGKMNYPGMQHFPWKQLYPDLFTDPQTSEHLDSRENLIEEDNQRLEDVPSGFVSSYNERFDPDDGIFVNIPSGVRSALFASLAIIGLSLVVFLAILVILKCLQKKTRAANYCSSLSSRMRSPMILQGRTAALKTFMNETLGRKKNNYFRSSMQSMSDEIWDSGRDRKPSF
ncbi:hypothetical protein JTB14_027598 [Gonioctena quinquepunctata]|nr:hypothetical protein JTB14_027598 [Gonioctena quinquepunctata]